MLASSIADVPLGFKELDELPYHVQATTVRLNKRRNAKNPVMPMPSKAIEVGSGMAATVTWRFESVTPAVSPVRKKALRLPDDVTLKSTKPEDCGAKLSVTVDPVNKGGVKTPTLDDETETAVTGAV